MNMQARVQTRIAPAPAAYIAVTDTRLLADPAGALVHESERLLVVADLHFEKGSAFASRRQLLPPYDTAATLARLTRLIMRHDPKTVIALGDSFHDVRAGERISAADRDALKNLMQRRQWIWIAGNHDPAVPQDLGGELLDTLHVGALTFRHEPQAGAAAGEIAGHLHPAARVTSPSGSVRRRCFVGDGTRCVMPAFGAYAGGLNIRDRAFAPLFGGTSPTAHVLGRSRIYAVGMSACGHD